jgi:hypothetical protein
VVRGTEPGELLKMIVALLEHQVLPVVETQSGRATLLLSVGMLDNLAERVEERRDLFEREQQLADALLSQLPQQVRDLVGTDPEGSLELRSPTMPLVLALRVLAADPGLLEDDQTDAWLHACHTALKERTRQDVALLNPTRYLRSQNA